MQGIPPTVTPNQVPDARRFLDDVIQRVTENATPQILAAGEDLLLSLAAIVICWTGLRQAFSGFDAWAWMQIITVIMIPWSILAYYDQPLLGSAYSFPAAISGMSSWAMNVFVKDAITMGIEEIGRLGTNAFNSFEQAWSNFEWVKLLFGVAKVAIAPLIISTCLVFFFLLFFRVVDHRHCPGSLGNCGHCNHSHAGTVIHSIPSF